MSQASKHVKWCLSKQKKETEEAKKLGKRLKHRGLLKIEPDIEKAKKHIQGVNDIAGLKTACTDAVYNSTLTSYCTINNKPVTYEVVTYSSGGGFQSSTCAASGCNSHNC